MWKAMFESNSELFCVVLDISHFRFAWLDATSLMQHVFLTRKSMDCKKWKISRQGLWMNRTHDICRNTSYYRQLEHLWTFELPHSFQLSKFISPTSHTNNFCLMSQFQEHVQSKPGKFHRYICAWEKPDGGSSYWNLVIRRGGWNMFLVHTQHWGLHDPIWHILFQIGWLNHQL